jgi:hydrogenase expression/formation protein HypE
VDKINLIVGAGARMHNEFIQKEIISVLNPGRHEFPDDAYTIPKNKYVVTTDGFTVFPLFFPGGNIGDLCVCGIVNDLVSCFAKPEYLTLSFIIEQGFSLNSFRKIIKSINMRCSSCGIKVICGDTKVVETGKTDGIFINATGLGTKCVNKTGINNVKTGDAVILTGDIGRHEVCILNQREKFDFGMTLESDAAPLDYILDMPYLKRVNFMRDVTRGGLSGILNEIVCPDFGVELDENKIPVHEQVNGVCGILGLNPLNLACEGRMVLIVDANYAEKIISWLKKNPESKNAGIIGKITGENKNFVVMKTHFGSKIIVNHDSGGNFPRIC